MSSARRVAAGVLVSGLFIALLGFGMTRDAREIPSPLIGQPAPEFALETLETPGDSLALADLQGTAVVVNFWASWCLACRQEHPALVRAWQRYEEAGAPVRFVGIVYQDSRSNAREYMARRGGGWTNLMDSNTRAAIDFGVYGVPETYFIDPTGRIAYKHVGPVTDALLTEQIEAMITPGPDAAEEETNR